MKSKIGIKLRERVILKKYDAKTGELIETIVTGNVNDNDNNVILNEKKEEK